MIKKIILLALFLSILLAKPASAAAAASLSFSPASGDVTLNNEFNVNVMLNTGGGDSDGTDAIIRYDGNKLQVISATLGSLYAQKVIEGSAATGTAGKITLSAVTVSGQIYNGSGTFATIRFKPIATGTANVYFDFTSGSKNDSNVAYQGNDILGSVSNATYNIGQAGIGGTSSPVPSSTPSVPVSGSVTPTIFMFGAGLLLVILGGLKFVL